MKLPTPQTVFTHHSRHNRKCRITITLVLSFLLMAPAFAENIENEVVDRFLANYVTTFFNTNSNGFPGNEANAVLQTSDGFIWFGGFSGLIRYDGRRFTQWNAVTHDSFTSSNVRSLYESSSKNGGGDTLWIGTNDKGLFSYENDSFTVYDMTMGTPSSMIRCITERADGMIFCGTSDGLFYIDNERNIIIVDLDTAIHPFIISIAADTKNNIYIVLNTGELLCFTEDGKTVQYPFGSRFHSVGVFSDRIFAGTQEGHVILTGFDRDNFEAPVVRQTPNINISSFYEDSLGLIWITSETGLGFLDASLNYNHLGNPNGVGFYSGIIEDYQNGYWITATRGGIVKFSVSSFTDLNVLYNFPTGSANAVVIDNGITYIGTDNNLLILNENGESVFTEFSSLINGRVRGVFRDSRGNIWICTYSDMGAIRFSPQTGEYRYWTPENGLASERTRSFTELHNGVIAIGTAAGVSFIRGDSVISAGEAFGTGRQLELPATMVLSLCVTADGTLYIGTDGSGVYAVNRDGVMQFREEDGLTGGVILRMFVNQSTNGVWVSPSNGLCYIDENKNVHVIDKVPPYAFLDIMQYNNELVLFTSSFIMRTDADALLVPDQPFVPVIIGRSAGLSSSITANAWNWMTQNNELYFCCDGGINMYNFERTLSAVIPYAGITRIDIDGTEHTDFSTPIQIRRNAFRLTIDLAYLSFGLLDNAEMYYMLYGQDNEKHLMPKTGSNEVSYTNLRGGNYIFRVWTEDSGGNIGNLIEVNMQKELKPLERPMVWIVIVILGTLAIALLFNLIYREKIRMQRLAMENTALDRVNRLKTDLMRTISHEMRTPLAVISGFAEITAENSRKNSSDIQTAQNLDAIAVEAKRMADMMEEMRQLALAQEYSKDRRPVDIGSVINQIARLYEKVMERKGTVLKLNIASVLPPIYANEGELTQVFFNLLRNADTHTVNGEITITAEVSDGFLKTTICDTGTGIAQDLLPHVFDRGVHDEDGGTGYGLAICRDIITAYEGEINIDSQPGKGAVVTFTLPVKVY